jgi:hypothetical protein
VFYLILQFANWFSSSAMIKYSFLIVICDNIIFFFATFGSIRFVRNAKV